MANRLQQSTSPYLLQHKDNPVDWYPWGPDAFEEAKRRDVPVLVSVGYSSCHWCHVMAHESFEDPDTAQIMNERFVNVKVDREERPDVDEVYMTALQAMTGHGGWPMTVFCTPEGKPFFAGTYFPKTEQPGMPSFKTVLLAVSEAYHKQKHEIEEEADKLARVVQPPTLERESDSEMSSDAAWDILEGSFEGLWSAFDEEFGGFGGAPKFPQAPTLEYILRYHWARKDPRAEKVLRTTLDAMATGGVYDHIGGGFYRYSVDRRWNIPHFEKMLYDNALLARLYLWAGQHFKSPFYNRIARETADFLIETLRDSSGGFYSSLDADTEGVEGGTYTFHSKEIEELLDPEHLAFAIRYFGISEEGNFEGTNHLRAHLAPQDLSDEEQSLLAEIRHALRKARSARPQPNCDDKVLASWNGLAIHALADIGRATAQSEYVEAAISSASFIKEEMAGPLGLVHVWRKGSRSPHCFSSDLASVGIGALAIFEATGDWSWALYARDLATSLRENFVDSRDGLVYLTPWAEEAQSDLIARPKPVLDNAEPSPNSLAALLFLKLARLFDDSTFEVAAKRIARALTPLAARHPSAFGTFLSALLVDIRPPAEIVVSEHAPKEMREQVLSSYLPDVALVTGFTGAPENLPILEGKRLGSTEGDRGVAYVCSNYLCEAPATDSVQLQRMLANLSARTSRTPQNFESAK